jgi:hypothetical protein
MRALGATPVGVYMRESRWGFAGVEAVHLLGLAVVGGATLILGLSVLGVALRRQPAAVTARGLAPLFYGGLAVMTATGVLLVASKPGRYYFSDPFRLKMLLLILGVVAYVGLHRRLVGLGEDRPISPAYKGLAVLLLALWLGVGLAGRAIGLL